jgi:hypothetical protein
MFWFLFSNLWTNSVWYWKHLSAHGDIYSYGILVLESVTGKRPTDDEFTQGLSLHGYVEHCINGGSAGRRWHPALVLCLDDNDCQTADDFFYCKTMIECLVLLLKLEASWYHETPSNTMSTGDIVRELRYIRESLTHVREHNASWRKVSNHVGRMHFFGPLLLLHQMDHIHLRSAWLH